MNELIASGRAHFLDKSTDSVQLDFGQVRKDRAITQTIQPLRMDGCQQRLLAHGLYFHQELSQPHVPALAGQLPLVRQGAGQHVSATVQVLADFPRARASPDMVIHTEPSTRVRSSIPASVVAFRPLRAVPSMPNTPTSETAAASSGGAAAPTPACWIGTVHPISVVNRVVCIVRPLSAR